MAYRPVAEFDLRAADIAVVSWQRWQGIDPEDNLHGAPELVIEIKSPSNTNRELREPASLCLANGGLEFWIAEIAQSSFTVIRRDGSTGLYQSGQSIPLTLFAAEAMAVDECSLFPNGSARERHRSRPAAPVLRSTPSSPVGTGTPPARPCYRLSIRAEYPADALRCGSHGRRRTVRCFLTAGHESDTGPDQQHQCSDPHPVHRREQVRLQHGRVIGYQSGQSIPLTLFGAEAMAVDELFAVS